MAKFEITKEIVTYTSLGTKCYSITFNENGNFKTTSKICGLSIQGKQAEKILLDEKLFNLYLLQFSKNKCIKKKSLKIAITKILKIFMLRIKL